MFENGLKKFMFLNTKFDNSRSRKRENIKCFTLYKDQWTRIDVNSSQRRTLHFQVYEQNGKSDLKLMNEIDLSGKNFSSHERVLIFRLKLLGGLATQSAMHEQVYFYTHSDHFRPIVR